MLFNKKELVYTSLSYSVLNDITVSFLLAVLAGMIPPIKINII